jgi:ribosomal protein S18 acetylase RimI-like enzyme
MKKDTFIFVATQRRIATMSEEGNRIYEVAHGSPEYWATVELRSSILRKPIGLRYKPGELEDEKNARHIVCYRGNRLVGCLMLFPREGGDVQMRQVAVVPELHRRGIGKALVEYSETLARNAGYRRMILHARETALAFYENLGYARLGDRFEEVTLPHWAMEKRLTDACDSETMREWFGIPSDEDMPSTSGIECVRARKDK